MPAPMEILRAARHVVVQDFPDRGVPDDLARAGLQVTIYGGPDERDVTAAEVVDGEVVLRPLGHYPDTADVFCTFRPDSELEAIIAEAQRLGAGTVWRQLAPGEQPGAWRTRVEAAGLAYVDESPITEVARSLW